MSARTKVRRLGERGRYDEATVHAILDEGIIAHVATVTDHGPVVLPTAYARVGRTNEADTDWPTWTGVIPITTVRGAPVTAVRPEGG